MRAHNHFVAAGLGLALVTVTAAAALGETCLSQGGQGAWRYRCDGDSCTVRPTRVVTENQHGTAEEDDFPFRFVLGPSAYIAVGTPTDTAADRLEITYAGDLLASAKPDAEGTFRIGEGKTFVDVGRALQSGKRLLLVFVDSARAVNTAVAALAHDGFAPSFTAALAALDAAAAGEACP